MNTDNHYLHARDKTYRCALRANGTIKIKLISANQQIIACAIAYISMIIKIVRFMISDTPAQAKDTEYKRQVYLINEHFALSPITRVYAGIIHNRSINPAKAIIWALK